MQELRFSYKAKKKKLQEKKQEKRQRQKKLLPYHVHHVGKLRN